MYEQRQDTNRDHVIRQSYTYWDYNPDIEHQQYKHRLNNQIETSIQPGYKIATMQIKHGNRVDV